MKQHPLPLALIATTLISGVALVYAWTGPSAAPYNNNAPVPINAGNVDQTKSANFVAGGLSSANRLIVQGFTMLAGSTTPRFQVEYNGSLIHGPSYDANTLLSQYNVGVGSVGSNTVYGYNAICAGNSMGTCAGTGGVVVGGANTSATVNINSNASGNSFFNGGNVGFGTNSPTQAPVVVRAPATLGDASSSLSFLRSNGNTYGYIYGSGGNGMIRMQHEGGNVYTELGARFGSAYFAMSGGGNGTLVRMYNNGANYWDSGLGGSSGIANAYSISYNYGSPFLTILNTGNIGIGTTTPNSTLSVAGTIRSSTGGFVFPDGTTQTTAATSGFTDAVRDGVAGDWEIANGGAFSQYQSAALEIREANFAGTGSGAAGEAPRISFHWLGRVASQIGMDSSGTIRTYNNPGTGYQSFAAGNITSSGVVTGVTVSTNDGSHLSYGGSTNYFRGPSYMNSILFDENNTAYYLDPASTSITNDLRANIFYDAANTGYYMQPRATSRTNAINTDSLLAYGSININNSSPTYYFQDTDGRTAMLHNNSNQFYILNSAVNNSTTWSANGSYWPLQIDLTNDSATLGGNVGIPEGNLGVGQGAGSYRLSVNGDTLTNGWFRTSGSTGWYSETYGGGWYMTDSTWIRAYNGKPTYMEGGFDTAQGAGVGCGGGMGGGTYTFRVCGAAGVGAAAYYYTSDQRLKENIAPLDNSLEKIKQLKGYTFTWKDGGREDVGVIAQEVEKVFPELVKTGADGYKSVEYGNLVAPLIEAVKELANQAEGLATRLFNLENRQTELEKQNETQAQQIRELQQQISELKTKK